MRENALAAVISPGEGFPVATHLPLEVLEENGKILLTGHLMKKTEHHLAFAKNENVLVIFNSVPAYISTAWCEDPATASTVNYMAVHLKGKISFTSDEGTTAAIKAATDKYTGTGNPASFNNIPQDYVKAMLKAIVGFKITVQEMNATFKLSQNRTLAEQKNIVQQLQQRDNFGDRFIAKKMQENLNTPG